MDLEKHNIDLEKHDVSVPSTDSNIEQPNSDYIEESGLSVEKQRMFAHPFSFHGRIRRLEYGLSYIIYLVWYSFASVFSEGDGGWCWCCHLFDNTCTISMVYIGSGLQAMPRP
jgi:hypothetical protein